MQFSEAWPPHPKETRKKSLVLKLFEEEHFLSSVSIEYCSIKQNKIVFVETKLIPAKTAGLGPKIYRHWFQHLGKELDTYGSLLSILTPTTVIPEPSYSLRWPDNKPVGVSSFS